MVDWVEDVQHQLGVKSKKYTYEENNDIIFRKLSRVF